MKKSVILVSIVIVLGMISGLYAAPNTMQNQRGTINRLFKRPQLVPRSSPRESKNSMVLTEYLEKYFVEDVWQDDRKVTISYDDQWLPETFLTEYWDYWDEIWYDYHFEEVIRGAGAKIQEIRTLWWDGSAWIPDMRTDFEWSGDKLLSLKTWYLSDEEPELILDRELTYDSQTNRVHQVTSTISIWSSLISYRVELHYDSQGRVNEVLNYDQFGDQWYLTEKNVVSYLPEDQSNYEVYYEFFKEQLSYSDHEMNFMHYTILLDEELVYFNTDFREWELFGRYEYHYDDNLNLERDEYWLDEGDGWYLSELYEYESDLQGNVSFWEFSEYYDGSLDPYIQRHFTYGETTSNQDAVVPEIPNRISIYPNPFNPKTTGSVSKVGVNWIQPDEEKG